MYSDTEIFLRELVSNAVDASQKLMTLSAAGEVKGEVKDLKVSVILDAKKKTLTIRDNGITISVTQWVKNTAGWWAEDKISEDEFVKGIEFLVKERIIDNIKTGNVEPASSAVPTWVKNNAGWWAEGQIDDNSFVKGIEYLVKVGLISVT